MYLTCQLSQPATATYTLTDVASTGSCISCQVTAAEEFVSAANTTLPADTAITARKATTGIGTSTSLTEELVKVLYF